LKFCDLATERDWQRWRSTERGKRFQHVFVGACLVPGGCVAQSKAWIEELVPTRESKLTHLLQSSLTGREKFVMIVNLVPTVEFLEENLNVLNFGSIACKIVTKKTETKKYSTSTRHSYFCTFAAAF